MNEDFNVDSPYLSHHGVLGMKWGVRRYQNPDGTLTSLGRKRVQKAMKSRNVLMTTKDERDAVKAEKEFRRITEKLYPAEMQNLIERIEKDEAVRKMTQIQTEDKILKGMNYANEALKIIGTTASTANNIVNVVSAINEIKKGNTKFNIEVEKNVYDRKKDSLDILKKREDIKKLKAEIREKEYKSTKTADELKKNKETINQQKSEINDLKRQVDSFFDTNSSYKQTISNQEIEIEDLKQKVDAFANSNYYKNFARGKNFTVVYSQDFKMDEFFNTTISNDDLQHHGILGMKWGVRRYQNKDGSLTAAGRKRYGSDGYRSIEQYENRLNDLETATTMLDKKIASRQELKNDLVSEKARLDSFIDYDGGTVGEHLKSKIAGKVIEKLDKSITSKQVEKEKGTQELVSLIEKLQNSGFTIKAKPTIRNVNTGADYVANLIAGPTAAASLGYLAMASVPIAGPVVAPLIGGLVSASVLSTSIYSLIKNTQKGTKFKIEGG